MHYIDTLKERRRIYVDEGAAIEGNENEKSKENKSFEARSSRMINSTNKIKSKQMVKTGVAVLQRWSTVKSSKA